MYIVDLIFFSAFLDLQSIRGDDATTPKELIFFSAMTHVPITSRKTRVEVANSGKRKHPIFSEDIRKLAFLIIPTTDYSKGFLRSLALRIIEV